MTIDASFYSALCFLLLIGLLYKKLKYSIQDILDDRIRHVAHNLTKAKEINHQARNVFKESENKLKNFAAIRIEKYEQAKQNASKNRAEYINNTQRIVNIKKQEFERYLIGMQDEILHKNQLRIIEIAHDLLIEAIKSENLKISNKLN
jgi:F0F1-type ATP synthase membrane subunit b/b'